MNKLKREAWCIAIAMVDHLVDSMLPDGRHGFHEFVMRYLGIHVMYTKSGFLLFLYLLRLAKNALRAISLHLGW